MSYCTYIQTLTDEQNVHKVYHDNHYGFPIEEDDELFCRLVLEINQAGLSWTTILNKQETFRKAYHHFNIKKVAGYKEKDVERLLADAGIIRNKLKVNAAIENAKTILQLQKEFGSFDQYLLSFIPDGPVVNTTDMFLTSSPLSDAVSKDLRRRGMKFVGTVTIYSFLQSVGIIIDHEQACFVMQELLAK